MKLRLSFLLLMMGPLFVCAQYEKLINEVKSRVVVNQSQSTVYAFALPVKSAKRTSQSHYYYWFAANGINKTKGDYDGRLLHGLYTEFYSNKELKERGVMKFGLKKGKWRAWYPGGELKEVTRYRSSNRIYSHTYFPNGELNSQARYRHDKLHGKVTIIDSSGTAEHTRYRDGMTVKVKKKTNRKNKLMPVNSPSDSINKPMILPPNLEGNLIQPDSLAGEIERNNLTPKRKQIKKRKGELPQDIKVRRFLWIIPVQPAPPKGKQI